MKKLWHFSCAVVAIWSMPARADWGWPPIGYHPPVVLQPDGTPAPCAPRYGLCSAWKRLHGRQCNGSCWVSEKPTLLERIRTRCGLDCGCTP